MEPPDEKDRLLFGSEVFQIQGAIYEVSRVMGPGFLEAVYQECLALEFNRRSISHTAMPLLSLSYKNVPLKQTYSPDFVCFDAVIVEIKAGRNLAPEHRAQVLNYLRATGLRVGLLVHFGAGAKALVERLVL